MPYNGSIVVEHSPQHPKVYGLSLAPAAGTGREKIGPNLVRPFYPQSGLKSFIVLAKNIRLGVCTIKLFRSVIFAVI